MKDFKKISVMVVTALLLSFLGTEHRELWQPLVQEAILGVSDESGFEEVLVSRVIDGDTIELSDGRKVRYIGIDTPETKHPSKGKECFGQEATAKNEELVLGQWLELEKDVSETDRYGRLLRYVWKDGQLINKVLVEQGYAYASSYPPDVERQEELRQAQQQATEQSLGLWAGCPH